jgi:hypothetical protein
MTEVFLSIEQFLQSNDGIQTAVITSNLDMTCFILIPRVRAVLKEKVAMLVVTCFLAYNETIPQPKLSVAIEEF